MTIELLRIMRGGKDITSGNEIRPGDLLSGRQIKMRKKTIQEGRAMKAGEVIDDANAWGDPFYVTCEQDGDYFLLWTPGNRKEWFINDRPNFFANYEVLGQREADTFVCRKKAVVTAFLVDRSLLVYGKEQNRDPAHAQAGDLVALDADGDPYRIPKSHYSVHYQILEGDPG